MFLIRNGKYGEHMLYKTFGLTLLISLLILVILLYSAGRFLTINSAPTKSDAIILLTGGDIERIQKALELFTAGYAPLIIVSNGLEDGYSPFLIELGIPESNIINETKADSTSTNAKYTSEIMKENKLKSAIVVSSDYHMRRVKLNFDRSFANTGIQLSYSSAPTPYNASHWYRNKTDIMTTINEYVKILGNSIGLDGEKYKQPLSRVNKVLDQKLSDD